MFFIEYYKNKIEQIQIELLNEKNKQDDKLILKKTHNDNIKKIYLDLDLNRQIYSKFQTDNINLIKEFENNKDLLDKILTDEIKQQIHLTK